MKETVQEAAKEMCEAWGMEDNHGYGVKDTFKVGFAQGAQWQAKQSPWISVEERLPEEYKEVLVRYKDCAETKYDVLFIYGSTSWCFADMEEYIDESITVTHWCPIPE